MMRCQTVIVDYSIWGTTYIFVNLLFVYSNFNLPLCCVFQINVTLYMLTSKETQFHFMQNHHSVINLLHLIMYLSIPRSQLYNPVADIPTNRFTKS